MTGDRTSAADYEYIVVGSGAGGGTVAARVAEAGCMVLLLEAGGDPLDLQSGDPAGRERLPEDYNVPAFHPFATENSAMSWQFFVRHYASEEQQKKDPKYTPQEKGVFYPRRHAGRLHGSQRDDHRLSAQRRLGLHRV